MYLFYVDESGDRDILDVGAGERYEKRQRFYVLFATGILEHHWHRLQAEVNAVKGRIRDRLNAELGLRPPDLIEYHEAEIKSLTIRRRSARRASRFWSGATEAEVNELVEAVYALPQKVPLEMCTVVVDKEYLLGYFDWEKLHRKSYELLLERIQRIMEEKHPNHKALVILDAVGARENLSLIKKHDYFMHEGTSSGLRLRNVVQSPLFVGSHLAVGIQVSDVYAYSVFHAFAYDNLDYEYFARIRPGLYNSVNTPVNRVDGLKVFPPNSPYAGSNVSE